MSDNRNVDKTYATLDARQLLNDWADTFVKPSKEELLEHMFDALRENDELPLPPSNHKYWHEKARVLHNMREVVTEAKTFGGSLDIKVKKGESSTQVLPKSKLEMVALIPQDYRVPLAVGVFSRGQLKDDKRRSIRKQIEQTLIGPLDWGRAKNEFDVFEVEGLAVGPGLPERSARVLLAKIEKYAHKEQRIVVVPKRAYISSDGTDLTEYYVRLGFEKVEMMKGPDKLVYMGLPYHAEEDRLVETEHAMIGMDLGTFSNR